MLEWLVLGGGAAAAHKGAPALIEKISLALGGLAEPWQMRRKGKADADTTKAKIIGEAEGTIQAIELYERAGYRMMAEQAKQQKNIENITLKALPNLKEESDPSRIDDDWLTNFFAKSRLTSDVEMQDLWGRILAGEANSPGTFSKKTINVVQEIEKKDAELFTEICSFRIDSSHPLIFSFADKIYSSRSITFDTVHHLQALGLVNANPLGLQLEGFVKRVKISYFHVNIGLIFHHDQVLQNKLPIGRVDLTPTGRQLAPLSGAKFIPEFVTYLIKQWSAFAPHILTD